MRRLICLLSVMGLVLVSANANAQGARPGAKPASDEGFNVGYFDVGPVVGFGGINGASASIGARAEYAFKALPTLGNGVLSIQASFDHYSSGNLCAGFGDCSYSYTPVGGTVNYHFRLMNRKLDPFFGVGLGDAIASTSCSGFSCGSASTGIYFIGRAGFRYFIMPRFSLYGDVGTGEGAVHVGVMFKLKG